ncbi:TetR/AcrR family transcriptional regulator [Chryseobacterium sp. 'Rf worker isolate 10']|uniref:TetR/AcrR family transcriptional regulator n=1 Tax=Chryseobacterium sp. 'Rf worker isolate 10' TaxID=2887348 RepID=UPI003D6EE233
MKRKVVEGVIRNKDKSKQRLLDAVGTILKTKGFSALKINDIAAVAGLDKKLIYNYFGGTDQLIDQYLHSQDYWSSTPYEMDSIDIGNGGRETAKALLLSQFDYVYQNKELQKIILWGLLENRKSLRRLAEKREKEGEVLLKNIGDPYFGDKALRFRAIMALLVSGSYYLDIYATSHNITFCGLDLRSKEGRAEIRQAMSFLIDQAYSNL